jgi:hypothetical protein
MKTFLPFLAIALLSFAGAASPLRGAAAATSSPASSDEKIPPERVQLKVVRVFSAKDGDAIFRAYLVNWKGQDVVVSDSLAKSNYKEGDTITVLVMNHPFPRGAEPHRLLGFSIVPTR